MSNTKKDETHQRPSRPFIEDFSSNIQEFSSNIQQSPEPPTPPPPPRHQDLIETQNELQKLTQTMTAFHPIPPPRQVLQWFALENQQSPFYVVNEVTLTGLNLSLKFC